MLQSHHGAQSNLHAAWFHKQRNAIKSASISNAKMWRIINKKVIRCDISKWYPCRPRLIYKNCVTNLFTWMIFSSQLKEDMLLVFKTVSFLIYMIWSSNTHFIWFIVLDNLLLSSQNSNLNTKKRSMYSVPWES